MHPTDSIACAHTCWEAGRRVHGRVEPVCKPAEFVAQAEIRRSRPYWYAYRRRSGRLLKVYLGRSGDLTCARLEHANTSTPLALIFAPSGFGKSTLLNEWRRTCGFPVAWLSLDQHDNAPARFWGSVILALESIRPDLGHDLLAQLRMATQVPAVDIIRQISDALVEALGTTLRLGLVLDDFQRIDNAEIYDALQAWIEHQPTGLHLVLSGHIRPLLALGNLRSRGLVTEPDQQQHDRPDRSGPSPDRIDPGPSRRCAHDLRTLTDVHARRPSGLWTDRDIRAYEALIWLRSGELQSAAQLLDANGEIGDHVLSETVLAELSLHQGQPTLAVALLDPL